MSSKITCILKKSDAAFGAILQKEVLAYLLSLYYKKKFFRGKIFYSDKIFTPKKEVKKFDNLFKFLGERVSKLTRSNKIKDISNYNDLKSLNDEFTYNITYKTSQHFIKNLTTEDNKEIFLEFRKRFWVFNRKVKNKEKTIVVHIRNYINNHDNNYGSESIQYQYFNHNYKLPTYNKEFFTLWFVSMVQKIIKTERLKKNKFKIILCSAGIKADFSEIENKLKKIGKLQLFINKSSFTTFKIMINADYLILSQSAFSYLASLINEGKKYIRNGYRSYLPFDVKIIKDYQITNISYARYLFNNLLYIIFRIKLKIYRILKIRHINLFSFF
jgi:hypothetical protein